MNFRETSVCSAYLLTGALAPLILRRLGADPATASTIILTTITDVISIALLLGSAAWLLRRAISPGGRSLSR